MIAAKIILAVAAIVFNVGCILFTSACVQSPKSERAAALLVFSAILHLVAIIILAAT